MIPWKTTKHGCVCCLPTPNYRCLSMSILKSQLVQFGARSMSMNCVFTILCETFLFSILVFAANSKNQEISNDLSGLGCAPPWVQMDESCYLFSNQSGTWERSQDYCSNQSSFLVEIGSRREQLGLASKASFIHIQITT